MDNTAHTGTHFNHFYEMMVKLELYMLQGLYEYPWGRFHATIET